MAATWDEVAVAALLPCRTAPRGCVVVRGESRNGDRVPLTAAALLRKPPEGGVRVFAVRKGAASLRASSCRVRQNERFVVGGVADCYVA